MTLQERLNKYIEKYCLSGAEGPANRAARYPDIEYQSA